uniref:ASD2 domain-containing protein n=1 Tax=Gopherus evgoodei TaxID=1825980 RepID=A0A8C4W9K4_9SAUR
MASYGNEIERWNLKQAGRIAELLEPVASPDYRNRLLPLKSISSIDHLLDSAYSSFSGGSNIPEYHSPSYYNENCCLPLEQLPYMDSEYVKGIYNPNAINSDPKPTHQHKSLELSSHHNSDNIGLSGQYRSTPTHGTLYQSPSPLTLPPHPPSPPSFKNDYREKLKVAQRKVLRETSFKRKDLQMSLPIRLKQKPSKRPSIEHLRSLSLSSANEDAKKRITEEQKKLCYSEPEKLNKLEDQQDQGVSWREESTGVKSDEINEQEQIQHIALIEYMERKIAQRPTSTLHKPPLQKRPSNAKRLPEGKTSNPDISRKTQKNEIICQFLSPERIPEPSPALIATGIRTNRHSASSSATETVHSKPKSAVRETDGNCTGKCASAENLQSGASVSTNDIALSQEKINCHTASSAQSEQGDKLHISSLNEKAAHNSQNRVLPEKETDFTKRRQKSPEDQRYEELAMEIIAKDNSLADILIPHPTRKTALDLLEGLFPVNISVSDRSHRKKGARMREEMQPVLENERQFVEKASVYKRFGFWELVTKFPIFLFPLQKELISSIQSKLQTLWGERKLVLSEIKEYALCGKELEAMVQDVCKPNEYERYLMFIGDLEKVVSLLLCLSSRLARVQNAMRKINENTDAEEKQSLNERHNLLSRQREDAKDLKENLDRRERVVSGILSKYLTDKQLQDYKHFVQVKTSLLIEQKDLEEQIKFLEEQLESLEKSILL